MTKRILVTGAAGFVGSHVVSHIIESTNHDVVCMVRLNNSGILSRITCLYDGRAPVVHHDLKSSVNDFVAKQIGHVDCILHLAANSHVDRSISNPMEFFNDNIIGTANLMEYARKHCPKARIINFSTDEVYGPAPSGVFFTEEDRFRPSNPYAASKASQNMIGHSYRVTYGMDVINTYTMNIFGRGQNPEKLIPKAIKLGMERKPMPVFSELKDGRMVAVGSRHWLHVSNVGSALMFIMEKGVRGDSYNIVGTDELTNEDVVIKVNEIIGKEPLIEYVDWHSSRPGHDMRYAISGEKLKSIGWVPSVGFDEGIRETVVGELVEKIFE